MRLIATGIGWLRGRLIPRIALLLILDFDALGMLGESGGWRGSAGVGRRRPLHGLFRSQVPARGPAAGRGPAVLVHSISGTLDLRSSGAVLKRSSGYGLCFFCNLHDTVQFLADFRIDPLTRNQMGQNVVVSLLH